MESYDLDEKPNQKAPPFPEGIVFGTLGFSQNGVVGPTVPGYHSPESNHSGVDLRSGVDRVELNGFFEDGSERKEGQCVVIASDQVCSVSETPVPPVAGEYSGERLVSLSDVAEVKNQEKDCEFLKLAPFDFNFSSAADAPAMMNGFSGESARLNSLSKDLNFINQWSNQVPLSYDPFGNHPHHTPNGKIDGFWMGEIDDMMNGLSVQDSIASYNSLTLSASANTHLSNQIIHYAPPPMMTGLSNGSSSSPNSLLDPLQLANSYKGSVPRHLVSDLYTHNNHLNHQASPYAPAPGPMSTDLSLRASSSLSNGLSSADGKGKPSAFLRFTRKNRNMVELSMTRDGSRCLSDLISIGNPTDIAEILEAVVSDVFTVMADEHGFKVFSTLLKFCDQTQKELLLDGILSDSIGVILRAQTLHGSNALIELVDHLMWSEKIHEVPSILATEIKPMMFCRFASAVIQHCLNVLKPQQNERLIEAMIDCACCLALDVYRCSFLYNLIDRLRGIHRIRLINKLADNSVDLAFHCSGNYVLKRILDLQDTRVTRKISFLLKGHYKSLAMDKHGSHVVEACLQSEGIHFVMDDLLKMPPDELQELACHHFANYVIKKAIQATSRKYLNYHGALVAALLPGLAGIKESRHGKNVYQKMKD